jgi:uncharacterized protein YbjT (DUF2867 family)
MMIVVTTPTGQIGEQVLENVLLGSEPVRVIAPNPDALSSETIARVEVVACDRLPHTRTGGNRR